MFKMVIVGCALTTLTIFVSAQEIVNPIAVKFHEPRTAVTETIAPFDPTLRISILKTGGMAFGLNSEGLRLTFSSGSIRTMFKIDNQIVYPNTGVPTPLVAKTPQDKPRHGCQSTFNLGKVTITQIVEAVPTRPAKAGDLRRLDSVLVRYVIENRDTQPHTVGTRVRVDTHCNNDGALFAAPTFPKKILDGIELKDKTLPPFVKLMQIPNLDNPGQVAHFTLKFGSRMIGPDRFVCTSHSAGENGWEVQVTPANGDSDAVLYWNDRVIAPGGKIELAYAYGKGLAITPESEGRINITFGGSFEPNKLFSICAYVDEPLSNQTLALDLPASMELVEGKQVQPVPMPPENLATSLVLWKCRVKDLGEHVIGIRSSNGITQTRRITVAKSSSP